VGKYADMVVLDRNPLKIDKDDIRRIRVVATMMGGQVTYTEIPEYDTVEPPHQE
jgi:predicted amidohydrolase YtcJ